MAGNSSASERKWPDKAVMDAARKADNPATTVWKCTVDNHGPTNILEAAIPIRIWIGDEKPELIYTVIVSPLDAGTMFTFYLMNTSPSVVNAVWPDTVIVHVLGESVRREVPLRRTYESPVDQIMMFFGSNTELVRGEPSE